MSLERNPEHSACVSGAASECFLILAAIRRGDHATAAEKGGAE